MNVSWILAIVNYNLQSYLKKVLILCYNEILNIKRNQCKRTRSFIYYHLLGQETDPSMTFDYPFHFKPYFIPQQDTLGNHRGKPNISGQGKPGLFALYMSAWVYTLQSEKTGRYYSGQNEDLERRLNQHNDPACDLSKTTKRFQEPWRLIWSRPCPDRSAKTLFESILRAQAHSLFGRFLILYELLNKAVGRESNL